MKNKALKDEAHKSGKIKFGRGYFAEPQKDPLMFANSNEFQKMKNRNKKRK